MTVVVRLNVQPKIRDGLLRPYGRIVPLTVSNPRLTFVLLLLFAPTTVSFSMLTKMHVSAGLRVNYNTHCSSEKQSDRGLIIRTC